MPVPLSPWGKEYVICVRRFERWRDYFARLAASKIGNKHRRMLLEENKDDNVACSR